MAPKSKSTWIGLQVVLVIPMGTQSNHTKNGAPSLHDRRAIRAQNFTTMAIKQNGCGLDFRST